MAKRKADRTASFWGMARSFLRSYCAKARRMSPETVDAYRIAIECYVSYLESEEGVAKPDISFDHFERRHVKGWAAWMSGARRYAPATVALRLAALRSFLSYCAAEDATLAALAEQAKSVKAPKNPRKPIEYLDSGELSALLAANDGATPKSRRNRMMLTMLYESAARVSELTGMELGDLSLAKPAHVSVTGKGGKVRMVPLGEKCVDHLRVYLEEFHPGGPGADPARPLFYSIRDGAPHALSADTVSAALKQAAGMARKSCPTIPDRVHCHLMRKSRAMALYKSGVPLPIVMQMLGHESMSTTSAFYAFATVDMMAKAVEGAAPEILGKGTGWLSEERKEALYSLR